MEKPHDSIIGGGDAPTGGKGRFQNTRWTLVTRSKRGGGKTLARQLVKVALETSYVIRAPVL